MSYTLNILHRPPDTWADSLDAHLDRGHRLLALAGTADPTLAPEHWLIAAEDREGSRQHLVFSASGVRASALQYLTEKNSSHAVAKWATLWNGHEELNQSASLSLWYALVDRRPCTVDVGFDSPPGASRLGGPAHVVEFFIAACKLYRPVCAWIWNPYHAYQPAFSDRPGVGWMLYLPRALTTQQVPEARSLIPVMANDDRHISHQIGTVIVSVTDKPFDETNPEHARIANAIEVRLVDQDLLPRYADL